MSIVLAFALFAFCAQCNLYFPNVLGMLAISLCMLVDVCCYLLFLWLFLGDFGGAILPFAYGCLMFTLFNLVLWHCWMLLFGSWRVLDLYVVIRVIFFTVNACNKKIVYSCNFFLQ